MRQKIPSFFVFVHILMAFFGCKNVDKSEKRNFFFYNEDQNISTLDPAFVKSQAENWVVAQIYEGLVEFDDSLHIIPCIAKRWTLSEDHLVYTFYLRNDVYFQPHEVFKQKQAKVTARDFVYSFRRIADPATASPGSWIFNDKIDISCFSDKTHTFPVKALNDTTLQITLIKPFAPFPGILAMPYCYVVPEAVISHYSHDFRSHPVGTGPFMLKHWEEEVQMLLARNPYYYGSVNGVQLPYLDGVVIEQIRNKQTAFMKFAQGKFDFFNGIDASIKDELLTKSGTLKQKYQSSFRLTVTPWLNMEYLGINIDPKFDGSPLNNKHIRQAINYAIDRNKLVIYLRNNIGYPATHGFVPLGLPGYPYPKGYTYDPAKARQLVKESGIDMKNTAPTIINTTSDYLEMCVFVQKELDAIGIPMKINVMPGSFLRQQRKEQQINFFRSSWIADYPDPENYLTCFYSPNFSPAGPNYYHYRNPQFDQLYALSGNQTAQERNRTLSQMDSLLIADAPVILLYYDKSVRLVRNNIEGLNGNPVNALKLKTVRKRLP